MQVPATPATVTPQPQTETDLIVGALRDLFAHRTTQAFGETREWWAEALIDAGHDDLCRLALPALSAAARRDLTAGAATRLRDELVARARFLMDKARAEGRELQL